MSALDQSIFAGMLFIAAALIVVALRPSLGLTVVGSLLALASAPMFGVAVGAMHEITALLLLLGGFGLVGLGAALRRLDGIRAATASRKD